MLLLQDSKKVLEQIEWYVQNKELEKFSGAFIMSAGNLCRQLVEQILFIIYFYGELPKEKYIKNNDKKYKIIITVLSHFSRVCQSKIIKNLHFALL